jgi:hypothetical protein
MVTEGGTGPRVPFPGSSRRVFMASGMAVLAVLAGLLAGCAGSGSGAVGGPAASPAGQAWTPRSGQAVWRPAAGADEVAGEILWAGDGTEGYLLEFSKPALPLVRVMRRGAAWEVSAPGRGRRSGRGAPPRLGWFVLADHLAGGPVADPWTAGREGGGGGGWWVENARTGERIEGFLEAR